MTRTRLASPTLVRLYLAQGHLDEALAVARTVRDEGASLGTVEHDLARAVDERTARLEQLLAVVRRRRAAYREGSRPGLRTAERSAVEGTPAELAPTGRTAHAGRGR